MLALLQLALCEFPLMLLGFPRSGKTRIKTHQDCTFSTWVPFPLSIPVSSHGPHLTSLVSFTLRVPRAVDTGKQQGPIFPLA